MTKLALDGVHNVKFDNSTHLLAQHTSIARLFESYAAKTIRRLVRTSAFPVETPPDGNRCPGTKPELEHSSSGVRITILMFEDQNPFNLSSASNVETKVSWLAPMSECDGASLKVWVLKTLSLATMRRASFSAQANALIRKQYACQVSSVHERRERSGCMQ